MRTTTVLFVLLCVAGIACAQHKLTITIDGLESMKGQVFVAVYEKDNFLKKPSYYGLAKVEKETVTVLIDSIASGEYAISLFHDENENRKLDMGAFGPKEKCGFSNNAKGKMGPPSFDDCKFAVKEDTEIVISVE